MHAYALGKCKDVLAFGPFVLDSDDLLCIRDKRVHLFPKQLEALRYLASRSGKVVTKDELLSSVWRDAFVGEGSLHHCISAIRKHIGDAAGGLDAVETVSKRGYRFVLPVTVVKSSREPRITNANALRIGILRFESKPPVASSDTADRLANRVAGLLSRLRVIGLEVTNQSALDRVSSDPLQAARHLGLSLLVTGRLFQKSKAGLGADVEILRASDQTILSSCVVAPGRPEDLETRLAGCIFRQLPLPETEIDHDEIAVAVEGNEECFNLYLEGLSHVRAMFFPSVEGGRAEKDVRLAIRLFTQATKRDTGHLASLVGLSNSVIFANVRGLISAEETVRLGASASQAALAIDPRSPGARAARATIDWVFDGKQDHGERELREVLEQRPFHFIATQFLAFSLMREGRLHEAIQIVQDFLEHRPNTAVFRSWLAYGLFLERKFESALREAKNCVELFPDWEVVWAQLCSIAAHTGDHKIALDAGGRLSKISRNGSLLALTAYSLAQCGEKQSAQELVDYILEFNRDGVIHSALVPALVALGRPHDALSCLEQAHRQRDVWVPLVLIDPRLDSVCSSPRFLRVRNSYTRLYIPANASRGSV
jgi:DNA-binding winged helix-turn-helix (wHTH) protein/tetratricopeptide (TPR) repeat protein